ncbi:MAG: HAMP domain-containing sensor histidine kinase, partial [Candidatus Roizmanbacteria bacterium]
NNIFQNARLKLTFWYFIILMTVSIIFSIVVFISLNAELERSARREQQKIVADELKIELPKPLPDPNKLPRELVNPPLNSEIQLTLVNSRNLLLFQLLVANCLVLGLSASAGYFLSGKTLKPIEEMIEEQKQFISDASHEFRTPLATLKTALEVTLRMGPIPYDQIRRLLESNLEDVNHLEDLTNKLLVIEQYSRGIEKNNFHIVHIDLLIKDIVKRLTPKAKIKQIKMSLNTIPLSVNGDNQGLQDMITNCIENAIKYNVQKGKIEIQLSSQNKYAVIQIKDTGIGISDKDIPHIFERFYRADNSRSKKDASGYGLGLHIVSHMVKQHNGIITVSSTINKGSRFIIQLPQI